MTTQETLIIGILWTLLIALCATLLIILGPKK